MIPIWGHRGCRGLGAPPENSLAAFAYAISQQADGFELDVYLTTDGHLVVFHDAMLEGRSNGSGPIAEKTLAELQRLRLKHNGKKTLSDERIPTLEEVLQLADGRYTVNIEIKQKFITAEVAQTVERWLAKGWQREHFLISSFYMPDLYRMREMLPHIPIGALFEGRGLRWNISEKELARQLKAHADLRPETVNITMPSITANTVAMIRNMGAIPVAWPSFEPNPETLSDAERAALAALYIDNKVIVITDYPAETKAMLKNRS